MEIPRLNSDIDLSGRIWARNNQCRCSNESKSVLVSAAMPATVILLTVSGPPDMKLGLAGLITLGGWILIGKLFPGKGQALRS
ncbi:MAG: hypothetical protein ACI80V_003696 [Rhodothermales bacterium]|jgi:hypothetical protein